MHLVTWGCALYGLLTYRFFNLVHLNFPCKGPLCILGKLVIGLPLSRSMNFCHKYTLSSHLFTCICVVPSSILLLHFTDSNCEIVSYLIFYKIYRSISKLIEMSSSYNSWPLDSYTNTSHWWKFPNELHTQYAETSHHEDVQLWSTLERVK